MIHSARAAAADKAFMGYVDEADQEFADICIDTFLAALPDDALIDNRGKLWQTITIPPNYCRCEVMKCECLGRTYRLVPYDEL